MIEDLEHDPIVQELSWALDPPAEAAERLVAAVLAAPGHRARLRGWAAVLVVAAIVPIAVWWRGSVRPRPVSRIANTGDVVLAVEQNAERWLVSGSGTHRGPKGMILISTGGTQ